MIRLKRDRAQVPAAFTGAKHLANEALLTAQVAAPSFTFKSSIWKKAKSQLRTECRQKCAYCDAPTAVVAHGDVEHFRPKSVYWWLAYCYDNYLFSCQICNETHKGDKFPLQGPALSEPTSSPLAPDPLDAPAVSAFLKSCKGEKAYLIDPYVLDPEPLFRWSVEPVLKEVTVSPRKKSGLSRKRAESSITDLGLNREELRMWRFKQYQPLAAFKAVFETTTGLPHDIAEQQLLGAMDAGSPFAAMSRYFVRQEWQLGL